MSSAQERFVLADFIEINASKLNTTCQNALRHYLSKDCKLSSVVSKHTSMFCLDTLTLEQLQHVRDMIESWKQANNDAKRHEDRRDQTIDLISKLSIRSNRLLDIPQHPDCHYVTQSIDSKTQDLPPRFTDAQEAILARFRKRKGQLKEKTQDVSTQPNHVPMPNAEDLDTPQNDFDHHEEVCDDASDITENSTMSQADSDSVASDDRDLHEVYECGEEVQVMSMTNYIHTCISSSVFKMLATQDESVLTDYGQLSVWLGHDMVLRAKYENAKRVIEEKTSWTFAKTLTRDVNCVCPGRECSCAASLHV